VHKEAVLKQLREPRRFSWKSTEAGARARGVARAAAREMPQAREVEVEGRVTEAMERPPLGGLPPPGEERVRGVSQGRLADLTGAHRCPRPRLGCRILKANGECC
jgi:hypothetical protein